MWVKGTMMACFCTIVRVASLVACGSGGCEAMVHSMFEYQGPLTPFLGKHLTQTVF